MVMEFGEHSKMSVGKAVTGTAVEGGAVIAGLLGAGFVGKQIENVAKPGVTPTSPMMDKLAAILANDGTKLLGWWLLRKFGGEVAKGETGKVIVSDTAKGMLGSVVLDLLIRANNDLAPKNVLKLWGIDFMGSESTTSPQSSEALQTVLRENSSLRSQLNSALQRLANTSTQPNVTVTPVINTAPIQKVANSNPMERPKVVPPVGTLGML